MTSDFHLFQAMAGAKNGGAEILFERFALGLHKRGIKQTLAIRPWQERIEKLTKAGIDTKTCKFKRFTGDTWRLKRMLKSSQADMVLCWMNRANLLTPKTNIPHIGRLDGYYNVKYYQKCDWLVAITKGVADYLIKEGVPAERITIMRNFAPDGTKAALPKNLLAGDEEIVFSSLGRFHKNKGFDVLLKALAKTPRGHLLLAGEGGEGENLKRLAEDLGITRRVTFLPWQPDPQSIMQASDIFICPSRWEPFGIVMIEALGTKKPLIATANAGCLEIAEHEKTALITPIDDVEALARAMTQLAEDKALRQSLAEAGYAHFKKRFTEEVLLDEWMEYLGQIKKTS